MKLIFICVALVLAHETHRQDAERAIVVYALATDARKALVTDLTEADFIVKEDGHLRQVVSVRPAAAPLHVAVIVDDNGTGMFRFGVNQFAQKMQGRAQLSLRLVTGQVQTVFDFTSDVQAWTRGIGQLGVRPSTPDGGQLLEGISDAARSFAVREASRPVIFVLTVGGQEHSTLIGRDVLDQLHRSRAALYVMFAGSAAVRSPAAPGRAADLLGSNLNLEQVLGDGPKQSGGRRRDVIATQALLTDVWQMAAELSSQYEVTYLRPPARNPSQKIQVTVARRGVNVLAPLRAPIR